MFGRKEIRKLKQKVHTLEATLEGAWKTNKELSERLRDAQDSLTAAWDQRDKHKKEAARLTQRLRDFHPPEPAEGPAPSIGCRRAWSTLRFLRQPYSVYSLFRSAQGMSGQGFERALSPADTNMCVAEGLAQYVDLVSSPTCTLDLWGGTPRQMLDVLKNMSLSLRTTQTEIPIGPPLQLSGSIALLSEPFEKELQILRLQFRLDFEESIKENFLRPQELVLQNGARTTRNPNISIMVNIGDLADPAPPHAVSENDHLYLRVLLSED